MVHRWCLIAGFSHRGRANVIEQYPLLGVGPHHSLRVILIQNSVGYKVNTQIGEGLHNKGCVLTLFFRTAATKAAKEVRFQAT